MANHLRLSHLYQERFQYLSAVAHAVACDEYERGTELMNLIGDRYNPMQLLDLINGHLEEISPLILSATTTLFLTRTVPEHILIEFILPLQDAIDAENGRENLQKVSDLQQRLASIQFHLGNIREAARLFESSISSTLLLKDYAAAAYNQQLLADCYLIMDRLDDARQCVRQALFYAEKYEIRSIQIHTLEVFSRLSLLTDREAQADRYISQAIALAGSTSYVRFWLFAAKAQVLIHQGNAAEAIVWTEQALEIVKSSVTQYDRSYVYLVMGQAYMLDKQYDQAAACFGYSYRHTALCRWLRCKTIQSQIQLCEVTGNKKKLKDKQAEFLRCCQESRYDWLLDKTIGQEEGEIAPVVQKSAGEDKALKIQTLGKFAVFVHGEPATIKRSASVHMLQYFLANRDRMVNRDEIIEAILPGSRYRDANYFNVVLSSLRKALEPGLSARSQSRYILRDEDRYRLDTSDISLDVKEFDALSTAASARDKEAAIPSLLALEALYAGDFVADYPYESYLEEERERLRKRYMEALLEIARYYKSCNEIYKSMEYYDKLLHKDPYVEHIYEEYLRMLLSSRAVSKARKVASQMVRRIEVELKIPCRKELTALFSEYQQNF